mmetsp:Transcript_94072/g.271915  ORF Transcript_94072/g.271915 Transcript_94072/m.271915 type:complete len:206 (-) Transcript_94072:235-852(-)
MTSTRTSSAADTSGSSLACATFALSVASWSPARCARPCSVRMRNTQRLLYCTSRPTVDSIACKTRLTNPSDTACRAEAFSFNKPDNASKQMFCMPPCDTCLSINAPISSKMPALRYAAATSPFTEVVTTKLQHNAADRGSSRMPLIATTTAAGAGDAAKRVNERRSVARSAESASHVPSFVSARSAGSLCSVEACSSTVAMQRKE